MPDSFTPESSSSNQSKNLVIDNFWDLAKKWIPRALASSTSFGILIVTLYFLKIRYLPIDSFSGMATLGGVVALLTFGALSVFAVLWGAPAATNLFFQGTSGWKYIEHRFLSREKSQSHPTNTEKFSPYRVFAISGSSIGVLWIGLILWLTKDLGVSERHRPFALGFMAIIWLLSWIWFAYGRRPFDTDLSSMPPERGYLAFFVRSGWFFLFSFSGAYPIVGFLSLSSLSTLELNQWYLEAAWLILGVGAIVLLNGLNLLIDLTKSSDKRFVARATQLGLTVACVLLVLSGLSAGSNMHDRLMQAASVRVAHAHVALQKTTCDALNQIGVQTSHYPPNSVTTTPTYCVLLDVSILSKLGSQWKIACARDSASRNNYRGFTIDAKDVVALIEVQRKDLAYSESSDVCLGA